MYVMVCTIPHLTHVVSVVSKFISHPRILHWDEVKWIFRYLRGTTDYDIMFNKQQSDPSIEGYMDADYTEDLDDKRSTMGYVFTFGGGLICWKFMIQSLVALSTNESEYMVVAEAINESLWLTGLVKELGIQQSRVQLYYDSESAIYLAKNQVYHARTKHIDVRFHKIRELVSSSELVLEKVHTSDNAVDMLTKLITIEKFKYFLNLINVSKC